MELLNGLKMGRYEKGECGSLTRAFPIPSLFFLIIWSFQACIGTMRAGLILPSLPSVPGQCLPHQGQKSCPFHRAHPGLYAWGQWLSSVMPQLKPLGLQYISPWLAATWAALLSLVSKLICCLPAPPQPALWGWNFIISGLELNRALV